jgi:hypothetical protein
MDRVETGGMRNEFILNHDRGMLFLFSGGLLI